MNEYEKKCAFIIFDLGLNRAPSKIPNTMWKYIKKILIKLNEKNLVKYLSKYYKTMGRQFSLLGENCSSYGDEALDYIKNHFNLYEKELIQDDDFYKFVKYFKKWEEKPKYFIGKEETTKIGSNKYKCYRIIANKDIPAYSSNNGYQLIKSGKLGGCIQSESNLSQEGNCWIYDNAEVMDNALVQGNARIVSNAMISRNAFINENAIVGGHAKVSDNAEIYGHAYIGDNAEVVGFSLIGGYTRCLKNNIYNNIKLAEEKNKDEEVQIEEINKILMKEFGKTVDDFLEEINDSLGTHDNTKENFLSTMAALTSLNKLIK